VSASTRLTTAELASLASLRAIRSAHSGGRSTLALGRGWHRFIGPLQQPRAQRLGKIEDHKSIRGIEVVLFGLDDDSKAAQGGLGNQENWVHLPHLQIAGTRVRHADREPGTLVGCLHCFFNPLNLAGERLAAASILHARTTRVPHRPPALPAQRFGMRLHRCPQPKPPGQSADTVANRLRCRQRRADRSPVNRPQRSRRRSRCPRSSRPVSQFRSRQVLLRRAVVPNRMVVPQLAGDVGARHTTITIQVNHGKGPGRIPPSSGTGCVFIRGSCHPGSATVQYVPLRRTKSIYAVAVQSKVLRTSASRVSWSPAAIMSSIDRPPYAAARVLATPGIAPDAGFAGAVRRPRPERPVSTGDREALPVSATVRRRTP
jgi:hypothetical protein